MPRRFSGVLIPDLSAQGSVGVLGPNEVGGARNTVFNINFSPGTSAGTVVIESMSSAGYTGTPANQATVAWAAANKNHEVSVPGNHAALQARISVAIVGGTVNVSAIVTD